MTLERRVAKLEESLSPTQLVLRWLAEAHSFGDIESYVASLLPDTMARSWGATLGLPSALSYQR